MVAPGEVRRAAAKRKTRVCSGYQGGSATTRARMPGSSSVARSHRITCSGHRCASTAVVAGLIASSAAPLAPDLIQPAVAGGRGLVVVCTGRFRFIALLYL